jgi:hypothetical protein
MTGRSGWGVKNTFAFCDVNYYQCSLGDTEQYKKKMLVITEPFTYSTISRKFIQRLTKKNTAR